MRFVLAAVEVVERAAHAVHLAFGPDRHDFVSFVAVVCAARADGHFAVHAFFFHLAGLADEHFLLVHRVVQGSVHCAKTLT